MLSCTLQIILVEEEKKKKEDKKVGPAVSCKCAGSA